MFCKNCGTPVNEGAKFCGSCGAATLAGRQAAPPRETQQYAYTPALPGKKASLFKVFLIAIPLQYICCFSLVAFNFEALQKAVFPDYYYSPKPSGTPYMHSWDIPMSQNALFNMALFMVIYGPSTVLLFFIIKRSLKRQKKAVFGFSIPLALYYTAVIVFSLFFGMEEFFYSRMNFLVSIRDSSWGDWPLFAKIIFFIGTFYPFIPPLLTLIRFEGPRPQHPSGPGAPYPAGAFGGITQAQMQANAMEGLANETLREIHEGYKAQPAPSAPAAKKPPVPLIILLSVAVVAAAILFLGRGSRTVTTNNTSPGQQTQQTGAGQSGGSRILWSTDKGLPVSSVKSELYKLCNSYKYYQSFGFDGKSGFINDMGRDWEWIYDINRVLIYAEEFEAKTDGRTVAVYGIDSNYAKLIQFSNTRTGFRDSRDKSDIDGWIGFFELDVWLQD